MLPGLTVLQQITSRVDTGRPGVSGPGDGEGVQTSLVRDRTRALTGLRLTAVGRISGGP